MAVERIVPGTREWGLFYANHIQRYKFAETKIREASSKNVLDAACGVGYGAKYLSGIEHTNIYAIDRSLEALDLGNKYYKSNNLLFYRDDCDDLVESKKYSPFDSIVSFETLEHLKHPELFIKNCKEVLKLNGQLIISTPNSNVSSPEGVVNWEFHEKEYTAIEVYRMLEDQGFKDIALYGQRYTKIGQLRMDFAGYINAINSNPLVRIGRWLQEKVKNRIVQSTVSEQEEDFEIVPFYNSAEIDDMGKNGPFVIIAIAYVK